MTKSRTSTTRILLGVLGKSANSAKILREWNHFLREQGINGSMDRYPCSTATLPERLSEMLHFDRRGYIVATPLQQCVAGCMDRLDASAEAQNAVDTIVNDGGVLTGFWTEDNDERRRALWFEKGRREIRD